MMEKTLAHFCLLLLLAGLAFIGWASATHAKEERTFDVLRIDLREHDIEIYWKTPQDVRIGTLARLQDWVNQHNRTLLFATNAGIYSPDYTPVGLHIEEGRERHPLNLRNGKGNFYTKPNGVFYTDAGGAHIIDSKEFKKNPGITMATQSGPLLLKEGQISPLFQAKSGNVYVRSAVGVVSPKDVVFVISRKPVNFYTLALFMKETLQCKNALYLDGSISRMYAPFIGRKDLDGDFAGMLAVTGEKTEESGGKEPAKLEQ